MVLPTTVEQIFIYFNILVNLSEYGSIHYVNIIIVCKIFRCKEKKYNDDPVSQDCRCKGHSKASAYAILLLVVNCTSCIRELSR